MTYLRKAQFIEINGQPQVQFALASAAERLADELQCRDADWTYDAIMLPSGGYGVVVHSQEEGEDEPRFLGFL